MKMNQLKGSYGVVRLADGCAVKGPTRDQCPNINREYIAYHRVTRVLDQVCVPLLKKIFISHDDEKRLKFVTEMKFEDAGKDLLTWFRCWLLFDPIEVLFIPLLSELKYLHNLGILHGDIHPSNICVKIDDRGRPKARLIDFGRSVVLRDEKKWTRHLDKRDFWVDPRTGVVSDQFHMPTPDSKEATLDFAYNISGFRDPMAVIALVANESHDFPEGLMLGPVDDVYGLGICIVYALTLFLDTPTDWDMLNTVSTRERFDDKLCVLCHILERNPAWNSSFFIGLHERVTPESRNSEDKIKFKASCSAIEIRLQNLYTLYLHFFDYLKEVYDSETSDLVKACVHPDRHHRYCHTPSTKRRRIDKEEVIRAGAIETMVENGSIIHVTVGNCWIMTGVIGSGKIKWWQMADGMMMRKKRGVRVLKLFIEEACKLDRKLQKDKCRDWPFEFDLQKRKWLTMLALHDDPVCDKEQDLVLRQNDTSERVRR